MDDMTTSQPSLSCKHLLWPPVTSASGLGRDVFTEHIFLFFADTQVII